jgi:lipopolysaccharide transport system ATP-binding protein
MTGRENIFLNGAILGMTKKEIELKIDAIIDFSGCERYIDTPVKRYSSGMTVRLAFAVAAFLEPEILIVDEVLAVGDAEFQKKAIGKMQDISRKGGRTVLFVSHNMAVIQKICNKCILLQNGKFVMQDKTEDVINFYLNQSITNNSEYLLNEKSSNSKIAHATKLSIEDLFGNLMGEIPIGKPWRIKINFTLNEKIDGLIIALGISDMMGTSIMTSWSPPQNLMTGKYKAYFDEEIVKLNAGKYNLHIGISKGLQIIEYIDQDLILVVSDVVYEQEASVVTNNNGLIINQTKITIEKD